MTPWMIMYLSLSQGKKEMFYETACSNMSDILQKSAYKKANKYLCLMLFL